MIRLVILSGAFLLAAGLLSCNRETYEPAAGLREAMQERMADVDRIRTLLDSGIPLTRQPFTRFAGLPHSEFVDDVSEYQAYFEVFDDLYEQLFKSTDPKKEFNRIIQSCAACHTQVCPGPLRAIRRLEFTENKPVSLN